MADLVRPRGLTIGQGSRLSSACVAAVALAACVCVLLASVDTSKPDSISTLANVEAPKPKLKFGDSAFHADASPTTKEGSIRKGIKPDFVPPLGTLGEIGLKSTVKPQALAITPKSALPRLAFGDAVFKSPAQGASAREGSVRNGVKPDFAPPLGDLGEVGLARKVQPLLHGQTLALKPATPLPSAAHTAAAKPLAASPPHAAAAAAAKHGARLAFGDATFVPEASTADAREGSVRDGVKPDFQPPLGDLGEVGLKAAPKAQTLAMAKKPAAAAAPVAAAAAAASASKMTDANSRAALDSFFRSQIDSLHPAQRPAAATAAAAAAAHLSALQARAGLEHFYEAKAAKDAPAGAAAAAARPAAVAPLSDVKAREGIEAFFARKAEALRRAAAKAKSSEVTAAAARAEIKNYFEDLTHQDSDDHQKFVSKATTAERAARARLAAYFSTLQQHDASLHAQAIARKAAENAALVGHPEPAAAAAAKPVAAVKPVAVAAPAVAAAAEPKQPTPAAAAAIVKPAAPADKAAAAAAVKPQEPIGSAKKARVQSLAFATQNIFDDPAGNRHGFRTVHMAKHSSIRTAIEQADKIAKSDLDDCGFTLC